MKFYRRSILLLPLALAAMPPGAAAAADAVTPVTPGPGTILIVRHAEKSAPNGDLPLSAAGHDRAQALAAMLAGAGITHVFTTEMIRARETAAPLAAKLGLTPVVVPVAQSDVLVARLKQLPAGAVVLVANHSGTIPGVVEKLGAAKPAPIPEERYDRMFIVSRDDRGSARSLELRYGAPTP